jgi:hypothetical protein
MIHYLILFLIGLSFSTACMAQDVKKILSRIPKQEKEVLQQLFYQIMSSEGGSYTLFGDKPISLFGDFEVTPYQNILCKHKTGGTFWKKWGIWEKYKGEFLIKNYLLIKEPSLICKDITNIIFINKKEFVAEVDKHINIFKKIIGDIQNGENLLKKIEDTQQFASMIKNHEVLWGILLGYGYHNAQLYTRLLKLNQFLISNELPTIPEREPTPSSPFLTIEDEFEYLQSKKSFFGQYGYSPLQLGSVHFIADSNHPETKHLQQKYQEMRGKISSLFANKDFLETVLGQLASQDSQ